MSRLVDPTVCPDCRAPLSADAVCSGCGLRLQGPLAVELFTHMAAADRVVERLRTTPAPEVAPPPFTATPPLLPAPRRTSGPAVAPPRRLPALSVPVVLLSLGGLFVLVAAVVFVAVAWGALGLTGRTLVMLGVTAAFAGLGTALVRRGLRGAAETVWLVVAAMLEVDLLGARSAGILGLDALGTRGVLAVLGGAPALLGVAVGLLALRRRTPLWSMQATVVAGVGIAATGNVWFAADAAAGCAVGVAVLAGLGVALRGRLHGASLGLLTLAALTWTELAGIGLSRTLEHTTLAGWWGDLRGWPLLVAAAYAAAATLVPRTSELVRTGLAALTVLPLAALANAPITRGTPTRDTAIAELTLLGLAAVTALATHVGGDRSRPWARAAGALGGLGAAVVLGALALLPWGPVASLASSPGGFGPASPWTVLAAGIAVAAVALALTPLLASARRSEGRELARVVAAGAVLLAAADTVVDLSSPTWLPATAYAAAAIVLGTIAWVLGERTGRFTPSLVGGLSTGWLVLLAAAYARPSGSVQGGVAAVLAVVLALAAARADRASHASAGPPSGRAIAAVAAAAGLVLEGSLAVDGWARATGLAGEPRALLLTAWAAVVALPAMVVTRRPTTRLSLELTALAPVAGALALAPDAAGRAWVLTAVAAVLAVLAVLHGDRHAVAWGSVGVLALSTGVRVAADLPRPGTVLLAPLLLLVVAGLVLRREEPRADHLLGSGLAIGVLLTATQILVGPGDSLAAILVTATAVVGLGVYVLPERGEVRSVPPAAAALAAASGGVALWQWAHVAALTSPVTAAGLAAYAAVVGAAAAPASRTSASRVALELTSIAVAAGALLVSRDLATTAMVLTLAGSGVAVVAVTTRDRAGAGWAGALVLGAATLLRVHLQVDAPELYTLPAAALLLGAGMWRVRTDAEVSSVRALSSGLTLALLPSLLLTLDDPVSLRGTLLAVGALALLALGVQRRLAAPFVGGAAVAGVLALQHLGPVAAAVPRWISLGLVGVLMLSIGISWEARLRDLRTARRYLVGLR